MAIQSRSIIFSMNKTSISGKDHRSPTLDLMNLPISQSQRLRILHSLGDDLSVKLTRTFVDHVTLILDGSRTFWHPGLIENIIDLLIQGKYAGSSEKTAKSDGSNEVIQMPSR